MSNYRDDREALRQRTESLETELAEKDRELERMRGTEDAQTRIARLESDLDAAQVALAGLRRDVGPKRGPSPLVFLGAGVGAVVAIGVATFALLARAPSAPPVVVVQAPVPAPVPAPVNPPAVTRDIPAPPPKVLPEIVTKRASASFRARVTKASGRPVAVGAPCTVDADLSSSGTSIHVDAVRVACGSVKLYDSHDPLNGMSMSGSSGRQVLGTTRGKARFAITWDDKGERTGERSQASLDTSKNVGSFFSTTAPAFQVELAIEPKSSSDEEPLLALEDSVTCRAQKVPVRVTSVTGKPEIKEGQSCSVEFSAGKRVRECRVRVSCGTAFLYGAGTSGYVRLDAERTTFTDGKPTSADGDPMLSWKVGEPSLVIKDEAFEVNLEVPKGTDPVEKL